MYDGQICRGDSDEDTVEPADFALRDGDGDGWPAHDVGKGESNAVRNDDGDAAESDGLYQPRAPRSPAERAKAEYGPGNLGLIVCEPVTVEVEPAVAVEPGPNCGPDPPAKMRTSL